MVEPIPASANPSCSLTVAGATTGIGFKKIIEGEAELAMMTRKVTPRRSEISRCKGNSVVVPNIWVR